MKLDDLKPWVDLYLLKDVSILALRYLSGKGRLNAQQMQQLMERLPALQDIVSESSHVLVTVPDSIKADGNYIINGFLYATLCVEKSQVEVIHMPDSSCASGSDAMTIYVEFYKDSLPSIMHPKQAQHKKPKHHMHHAAHHAKVHRPVIHVF